MTREEKELTISICTQYEPVLLDCIKNIIPRVNVNVFTEEDDLLNKLDTSDIVFLQKEISLEVSERMAQLISAAEKPRWLHWGYTGLDQLMPLLSLRGRLLISNSKGLVGNTLADHVLMVIQMLHREIPRLIRSQMQKTWERLQFDPATGKTLGIIGLGIVGKNVALKAEVFGMRVIGMARRKVSVENVDKIFLPDQLQEFLAETDTLVISVPLTEETHGLIGDAEFACMKPKSYLINIARGDIVDEDALVRAIKTGHIAGAALDVFVEEPLSAESELWSLENVIITPHNAGWSRNYPARTMELFCENLKRFLKGKDLINKVI